MKVSVSVNVSVSKSDSLRMSVKDIVGVSDYDVDCDFVCESRYV